MFEFNNFRLPQKSILILALNEKSLKELDFQSINAAGFMKVIKVAEIDFTQELYNCFENYCKEKEIATNHSIIQIQNVKVGNPFIYGEKDMTSLFLSEFWDIFECTEGYVEGPYSYGEVTYDKKSVCFDIGANIGLFSLRAAAKGCQVYSFEPNQESAHKLKYICHEYLSKISLVPLAVMDYSGTVKFYQDGGNGGGNSVKFNLGGLEGIEIPCTSLDDFVRIHHIGRVDFIKADIEGAERNMLMGAKDILARYAPKLSVCTYHLPDDKQVLEKLILDANPNYRIVHKWEKLYAYVPGSKQNPE